MSDEFPRRARFTVRHDGGSHLSVKLNDLELSRLILSGGLQIDFVEVEGRPNAPQVTMTLAAGALDFDLDVEALEGLLAIARDDEGGVA